MEGGYRLQLCLFLLGDYIYFKKILPTILDMIAIESF